MNDLPWSVVGDEIESTKGTMEIITENVIRGILQGSVDPVVARTGEASADKEEDGDTVINLDAFRRK